jgi:hypothetical protein
MNTQNHQMCRKYQKSQKSRKGLESFRGLGSFDGFGGFDDTARRRPRTRGKHSKDARQLIEGTP